MELANGKENKMFSLGLENRYYIEGNDVYQTPWNNQVCILANQVTEKSIVLDIGCGSGKFGKILHDKQCVIYGIEIDNKAAECAKNSGYYKEIFVMDVTDEKSDDFKSLEKIIKPDIIIMSDILEHLSDPTKVLCMYSKLLQPGGNILVSVPNISHMDIIANLINGKFNYTDMGILDNTHLKFFTKSSFIEWINQINTSFKDVNLDCEYIGATFYNSEYTEKLEKERPELYSFLAQNENYNALQILFKLTVLSPQDKSENLNKLLKKDRRDIILSSDSELQKNFSWIPMLDSEKINYSKWIDAFKTSIAWHEEQQVNKDKYINQQQTWIEELKKSIAWHEEQQVNKDKYINQQQVWVEELRKSIAWHEEQQVNKDKYINQQQAWIEELKKSIAWHEEQQVNKDKYISQQQEQIQVLENELTKMKNKFIWKIYKKMKGKL